MSRRTKIICTLGPACSKLSMLRKMVCRGMDIARMNFSHGDRNQQLAFIKLIRQIQGKRYSSVKLLGDLEGYRIRVGRLKAPVLLKKKEHIFMSNKEQETSRSIPFDYVGDCKRIKKGFCVFIDDGNIALQVIGHRGNGLRCEVLQGGFVRSRKGINIPKLNLGMNILTPKDEEDLLFAVENRFDYIAQSFVRNKRDIQRISDWVKSRWPRCQIIAKIENEEGVKNLDSIMASCDGIMIARGDLGVSIPVYKIAIIQKEIIRRCNKRKKIVITATQMLDNMIEHSRPTRAEVTDISNAILDGTDMVMLSAETAVGHYPSRSILMMRQIIEFTEGSKEFKKRKNISK